MEAIEIKGLTKQYGKFRGITNINLTVPTGEIFGFIGPNGAGKSTTIRLLLDLIHPTSGQAFIFGQNCFKETVDIKRQIGYLPSEISFYDDMTIRELFQFSARFYKKDCTREIERLCSIFEVDQHKKIYSLSLGNKKKVGIIQALIHKPRLLIMDEPTSGLDPLMIKRFSDVLSEVNKKECTIFFSSHVLSEVQRLCNRVAFIREGQIIKLDTVENLRSKSFRKVKLELDHLTTDPLPISGARNISKEGKMIEFIYTGEIQQLLTDILKLNVNNVWIEEPTLDDIFMHYYEEGTNESVQ